MDEAGRTHGWTEMLRRRSESIGRKLHILFVGEIQSLRGHPFIHDRRQCRSIQHKRLSSDLSGSDRRFMLGHPSISLRNVEFNIQHLPHPSPKHLESIVVDVNLSLKVEV